MSGNSAKGGCIVATGQLDPQDLALTNLFHATQRIRNAPADGPLGKFISALTPAVVYELWALLSESDLIDSCYVDRMCVRVDDGDKVIVELRAPENPADAVNGTPDTFFVRQTPLWLLVYGLVLAITNPVEAEDKHRLHGGFVA
jgi:hypothetical protein